MNVTIVGKMKMMNIQDVTLKDGLPLVNVKMKERKNEYV